MAGVRWGGSKATCWNHLEAYSLISLAVDDVDWEPSWLGHPSAASSCPWASLQPGGWILRATVSRQRARWKPYAVSNLILEVTQC